MQLHSQVALLRAEFQPRKLSPQSDLQRRSASRCARPQISSFFSYAAIGMVNKNVDL